ARAAPSFEGVMRAVAAKNWKDATEQARALDSMRGTDDFLSLYVIAARLIAHKRCDKAVPVLNALMTVRPSFVPAHELAFICYRAAGNEKQADRHLTAIIAIMPEGPQRTLFEQARTTLRSRKGASFSVYVDVMPSSNVNRQTAADRLGALTITDDAKKSSGVMVRGGVSATRTFLYRDNFNISGVIRGELAMDTVDRLLRPALIAEMPVQFTGLQWANVLFSPFAMVRFEEDKRDFTSVGARAVVVKPFANGMSLGLVESVARQEYPLEPYRDGWRLQSSATLSRPISARTRLTTTVALDYNDTDDARNRTLELSGLARIDHLTKSGFILAAQVAAGWRGHSEPPPLSRGPDQTDRFIAVRGEIGNRNFKIEPVAGLGAFIPTLYYQYTRQWSDNVFYDYDSHDVGVLLRSYF
ncbi:MAG: hypothetical protein L0I29_04930, partial [Hyphomicrobiales bacterium]|nr:hypothetical protein [Hyphomicrobiales bacterium]